MIDTDIVSQGAEWLREQIFGLTDTFEQCEAEVTKQLSAFIKPLKKNLGRGII